MRLLFLFMRSRQIEHAVGALVVICIATWLWGRLLDFDENMLVLSLVLFPLLAGATLGNISISTFGELELTVSRDPRKMYLAQSIMLLAIALAGFIAATWNWQVDGAPERSLRNLCGFAGLTLLTATLVEGRLAWFGPIAYGIGSFWLVLDDRHRGWAVAFRPEGDKVAISVAVAALIAGLALISRRGPRD